MTSFCADACAICDIDGFTGRNDLTVTGQQVDNFCTTFTHNMSFIAFIAGTEDLSIEVDVTNCVSGNVWGLEIGIFESFDCNNFTPVSECNTDVAPNTTVTFSNTVPLVVGQHYYLMMDGSAGDICDWTFRVTEGSTAVGLLSTSGVVESAPVTCPEVPTRFVTSGLEAGAVLFDWFVDGVFRRTTTDPQVDLTFPADGTYEVCVRAGNVCDQAPASCTTVRARTVGSLTLTQDLCAGQTLTVAGTVLDTTGRYEFTVPVGNGCDSLITVDLTLFPQPRDSVMVNQCTGEFFFIGDAPYGTTGTFLDSVPVAGSCDSLVHLELRMIECEITGTTDFTQPACRGEASGSLFFTVDNGTPPFTYDWSNITDPTVGGDGTTNLLVGNEITGVPAGRYEINVRDGFGNDAVFFQTVTESAELTLDAGAVAVGAYNLSCFGAADGTLVATVAGGRAPYAYRWSDEQAGATATGLAAGTYGLTVTDANGCSRTATAEIVAPPAVLATVAFTDLTCGGPGTGTVELLDARGGSAPYRTSLDGGPFDTLRQYAGLDAGLHTLVVRDDQGCTTDTTAELRTPQIPAILPWEPLVTALGCPARPVTRFNGVALSGVRWSGPAGTIGCDTCLNPVLWPTVTAVYRLQLTSVDGCTATDSVRVIVEKPRDVYAPTAFSPNDDGVNDRFLLGLGKAAVGVRSLRIFDRWGALVYAVTDLPAGSAEGWDGRVDGRAAPPGVYVWTAEVSYLDGVTLPRRGAVTLLR